MTTPTPLPESPDAIGESRRASRYMLDVDTSVVPGTPAFLRVFGLANFVPTDTFNLADNTDYDSVDENNILWTGQAIVSQGYALAVTFSDKKYEDQRDPGQAYLKDNTGKLVHIRWYDRAGDPDDAFEGYVWVQWSDGDGGVAALSSTSATLTGDGAKKAITNPKAA